jgi:class 3 adenylate cyclase
VRDQAKPGQIVVADVVRQLATGEGFLFSDLGDVVPKGLEEPVRLFEVRWRE